MTGLEALGILANIIQVVQASEAIVTRINDFRKATSDVPETFQRVSNRLVLLANTLKEIKEADTAGNIKEERALAIRPVIKDCAKLAESLQGLILKALPKKGDSEYKRGYKAVASFRYETDVLQIGKEIETSIQFLTFDNVVAANTQNVTLRRSPPTPEFLCPFWKEQDFIERQILFEVLSRVGPRLALCGLGGVGKSQIAIEYGYRLHTKSPQTWVFWVHAGSVARLEEDYKKIAKAVRIPGWDEKDADILGIVCEWLSKESNGPWVIILDNADSLDVLTAPPPAHAASKSDSSAGAQQIIDFLPHSPKGSILITTRNREVASRLVGNHKRILRVEPMDETEGVALLKSKLDAPHREDEMRTLVRALDYMPLAISQAAAYISNKSPRVTISSYLRELKTSNEESTGLLDENMTESHRERERSNSIVATWQVSFQYVRQTKPSAARLLSLMCLFDRQGIPEALLTAQYGEEVTKSSQPRKPWWKRRRRVRRSKRHKPEGHVPVPDFDEDWITLTDFSFIKTNIDGHHFSMHALVQFTTKKWLSVHGELQVWSRKYITVLNAYFPDPHGGLFASCEPLVAHAYAAIPYRPAATAGEVLQAWARLVTKLASYTDQRAAIDTAEKFYRAAVKAFEDTLGPNAPETLACLYEHGVMLFHCDKLDEAEKVQRRVLEGRRKSLGPEHNDTLETMDYLSNLLTFQRNYQEAEALQVRAVDVRLRTLGKSHKSTLEALEKRGIFLMGRGRYTESYETFRQAHDARSQGNEEQLDPSWTSDLDLLGLKLFISNRFAEAEPLLREAVTAKENMLGYDHWRTMKSVVPLARALHAQDKHAEAETFYRRGFTWYMEQEGDEHEETLKVINELASVLASQDKLEEAEKLNRKSLGKRETVLGPAHMDTLESAFTLAGILEKQARFEEALLLYERAYNGAMESAGESHEDTKEFGREYERLQQEMTAPLEVNLPSSPKGIIISAPSPDRETSLDPRKPERQRLAICSS